MTYCISTSGAVVSPQDLSLVASRLNQSLPKGVAKDLRQDMIKANGMALYYYFTHLTLTGNQLKQMHLESSQRPNIIPQICSDPTTSRLLREGVAFHYIYRGRDGAVGGEVLALPTDCAHATH
jgi:hypothetical protein